MSPPLYLSMVSILPFALFLLHWLTTCGSVKTEDGSLDWVNAVEAKSSFILVDWAKDEENDLSDEHFVNYKKEKNEKVKIVETVNITTGTFMGYSTLFSTKHNGFTDYSVKIHRSTDRAKWDIPSNLPEILTQTIDQYRRKSKHFERIASQYRIRLRREMSYSFTNLLIRNFNTFEKNKDSGAHKWTFVQAVRRDDEVKPAASDEAAASVPRPAGSNEPDSARAGTHPIVLAVQDSLNSFRVLIKTTGKNELVNGCSVKERAPGAKVNRIVSEAILEKGTQNRIDVAYHYCVFDEASTKVVQKAVELKTPIWLFIDYVNYRGKQKNIRFSISDDEKEGRKSDTIYAGDFKVGSYLSEINLRT
eukprot:GHVS01070279.1.p1 GENE.GHVS01070279.1~~GHVS01070279.1.p1  ORF type:complete len:362 (+),score=24.11 GHVS01070279.1:221-1306(+)